MAVLESERFGGGVYGLGGGGGGVGSEPVGQAVVLVDIMGLILGRPAQVFLWYEVACFDNLDELVFVDVENVADCGLHFFGYLVGFVCKQLLPCLPGRFGGFSEVGIGVFALNIF